MTVKLHAIRVGVVEMDRSVFLPATPKGVRIDAPGLVFVIQHPQGNVVVDTGIDPQVYADPVKYWGGLARALVPKGDEGDGLLPRLEEAGFSPDDVKLVVNTHLHMDHAGCNRFLPRATFLVHRAEMEIAPEMEGNGYYRSDWDYPLSYRQVDGETDLFDDGLVKLVPLPGHTPGSMGLVLKMSGGVVVLSGDSCPLADNLAGRIVARTDKDPENSLRSMEWLAARQQEGASVIFGHDNGQWPVLPAEFTLS
ncbi:MAG: N-acyl homoserine lactonase family protein [Dehalococcoidia bacterium]|jgi:glyoxylase-like metal-dependent hydrolase (beta-lactamase superfamily II)|nr:N-acyl homoserine lactonase family protein [Dehalococcoidia bacterium]